MDRYLTENIRKDLVKKAIILSGPRQVGKTTLAKSLFLGPTEYLNYDILRDRKVILAQSWAKEVELVILDEVHKFPKWKNLLKGVIDQYQNKPSLIVTGSARLEVFRRAGDALTGRTFAYHLHPIDVGEALSIDPSHTSEEHLSAILKSGGFPESFANPQNSDRLLQDRIDTVLRDDLRDLSRVTELKTVELLVELLRERVGGQIAYSNLSTDLSVSPPTIKNWLELLERLYLISIIRPYSGNLAKSIRKEPKCYFFDCSAVIDESARLENLVALALLKYCDLQRDTKGRALDLRYYRDSSNREVDFVITEHRKVIACIEIKSSDDRLSTSLRYLTERLNPTHAVQLVRELDRPKDHGQIKIRNLAQWLSDIRI